MTTATTTRRCRSRQCVCIAEHIAAIAQHAADRAWLEEFRRSGSALDALQASRAVYSEKCASLRAAHPHQD